MSKLLDITQKDNIKYGYEPININNLFSHIKLLRESLNRMFIAKN